MSDMHSHKCPKCGTIWRHDADTLTDATHRAAHTCPVEECGGRETWRHFGEGEALYCHNGVRTVRLELEMVDA